MMKKTILSALVAVALSTSAYAAGGESHVEDFAFSFEGPFGTYDQHQLQRGLQVYTEVCAACHGLQYVAFRTLGDEGGPHMEEGQVKAYAALYEVFDPELDDYRAAIPSDMFPVSGFDGAPDLSLMAKARAGFHGPAGLGINQVIKGMGGAEYIASILAGYTGEEKEQAGAYLYENTAFPGGWTSMPPPLEDDLVEYQDGHEADIHHMAMDVSAFLMWAAEPKMTVRKETGFYVFVFLVFFASLMYLTNKKLWAPHKRKD